MSEIGSVNTPRNILIGFALIIVILQIGSMYANRRLENAEDS